LWNFQLYNEELKDTSHPVALPRHVETVKNSVMKFLQSIEPYEKTLGPERKQGWYRGVSSKTKWALFVAKEANILKERVAVPMTAINVNVGLQIMLVYFPFGLNPDRR
jgi:hypothetical protein